MIIIIMTIIIINIIYFIYVSGYLACKLTGDTTRTNRNKMLKIITTVVELHL